MKELTVTIRVVTNDSITQDTIEKLKDELRHSFLADGKVILQVNFDMTLQDLVN